LVDIFVHSSLGLSVVVLIVIIEVIDTAPSESAAFVKDVRADTRVFVLAVIFKHFKFY